MKTGPKPKPDHDRFFSKVNKDGPDHPYDNTLGKCWLWTGAHYPNGYGVFGKWADGKTRNIYAHRFSYEYHKGAITAPDVCHSCDVRDCVNPAHLWNGTRKENIHDAMNKGRMSPVPTEGRFKVGKSHPVARGESHGNAKLRESDVVAIRSEHTGARGQNRILAVKYSVTPGEIQAVVTRKIWKHVV